jgi:hypothetical protein
MLYVRYNEWIVKGQPLGYKFYTKSTTGRFYMITAAQMKAGRALVGLTQDDVAKATTLSVQTIKRMETIGTERSSAGNVVAVQRALEAAGLVFIADGEHANGGAGVRLAKPKDKS